MSGPGDAKSWKLELRCARTSPGASNDIRKSVKRIKRKMRHSVKRAEDRAWRHDQLGDKRAAGTTT